MQPYGKEVSEQTLSQLKMRVKAGWMLSDICTWPQRELD